MEIVSFEPLWWLLGLAILAVGLRFSLVERPRALWIAAFAARCAAVALLVLALCRPFVSTESRDLHVVFLVDVSESIDLAAAEEAGDEIERHIAALGARDGWSLFAVANGVRAYEPRQLAETLQSWREGIADDRFRSASRLGRALLGTRAAFPAGKAHRVVLFSDGQETEGELASAIDTLREEGVDISFERIAGLSVPEAAVLSLEASTPVAFRGEIVRMTARLATNARTAARLRILHRGVSVAETDVELDPNADNTVRLDVEMRTSGSSVWTAELIAEKDHFAINNRSTATVTVRGEPRVLILHEKPRDMRPIARALREQELEVDVRGEHGLPDTLAGLLAFDAIVLANLAATSLTSRQMELLEKYVSEFGGGLAMLGSDSSFGLGGYYRTPVEDVLPLVSRFEKEKEKPSLAMVLVLDKSGSMTGVPIALARQAARSTVEILGGQDQIGLVAFDGEPYVVSEMKSASDAHAIRDAIDRLDAGGGTNMYPAMSVGKDMLDNVHTKIKHMILLGDGQTQPADHEGLTLAMVDARITVSTVALGPDADRQLMAQIAKAGRGRYYETMDPTTVPQIFTKETMQASRSAIKEDYFGTVQTGDHPLLSGYVGRDLPFTLGYVMTEAKPTAQVLLSVETGDPLLAVSRFGLGTGLAFSSDLTERWGGEWLAWEDCGRFWAQALRAILRKTEPSGVTTRATVSRETWSVDVGRRDERDAPVSGIEWEASALSDHGTPIDVRVDEVGLGKYRADIPLAARDSMTLRLLDREHDRLRVLHYQRPYPAEYRLTTELPAAAASLRPLPEDSARAGLTAASVRREASPHLAHQALPGQILGVLRRRL